MSATNSDEYCLGTRKRKRARVVDNVYCLASYLRASIEDERSRRTGRARWSMVEAGARFVFEKRNVGRVRP